MFVKAYAEVVNEVKDLKARAIKISRSEIVFRIQKNQANNLVARLNQFGPTQVRNIIPLQEVEVSVLY